VTLGGGPNPEVLARGNGAEDATADALLKAMAKKITWWAAAELIG
jgi:hypothetical protein